MKYKIIKYIVFVLSFPMLINRLSGEESEHSCGQGDISCIEKILKEKDLELNRYYGELRNRIDSDTKEKLKIDSIEWISRRDYLCDWRRDMDSSELADFTYRECLLLETTDRLEYLKTAFGGEGSTDSFAGTYSDGNSGVLTIGSGKSGLQFYIQVVRGPTFHLGEIRGAIPDMFRPENRLYRFTLGLENDDPYDNCTLDFTIERLHTAGGIRPVLKVVEDSRCLDWHGARAYFDGTYRKTSDSSSIPAPEEGG